MESIITEIIIITKTFKVFFNILTNYNELIYAVFKIQEFTQ